MRRTTAIFLSLSAVLMPPVLSASPGLDKEVTITLIRWTGL